jgi:hypothetical protein
VAPRRDLVGGPGGRVRELSEQNLPTPFPRAGHTHEGNPFSLTGNTNTVVPTPPVHAGTRPDISGHCESALNFLVRLIALPF